MILLEVAALFLRLGFTAFGGPAAHVSLMHDEVVQRRKWLTDQEFLDLLGATNLIPGPNSTEMAIHIGYRMAGFPGLLAGGLAFILPAAVMVTILSVLYVRYGSLPTAEWLLYGIKPVVLALIAQALWSLGKKAIRNLLTAAAAAAVFVLFFFGIHELLLLFAGGMVVMLVENARRLKARSVLGAVFPFLALPLPQSAAGVSLWTFFLNTLKIGSVWYGGGYVLLAFLRTDFVERLGWLTDQQLLDAVAIGQVTPGPLFTTVTFIGYTLAGLPGALVGTIGILLPSFVLVALSNPIIPKVRSSPWTASLLDGVNATALGLMAAVSIQIGQAALVDVWSVAIAAAAAVLLFRYRVNSTWLIAGGAAVGLLMGAVR